MLFSLLACSAFDCAAIEENVLRVKLHYSKHVVQARETRGQQIATHILFTTSFVFFSQEKENQEQVWGAMQTFPSGGAKKVKMIRCAHTPISERNAVIMTAVMSIKQQKEKSSIRGNINMEEAEEARVKMVGSWVALCFLKNQPLN